MNKFKQKAIRGLRLQLQNAILQREDRNAGAAKAWKRQVKQSLSADRSFRLRQVHALLDAERSKLLLTLTPRPNGHFKMNRLRRFWANPGLHGEEIARLWTYLDELLPENLTILEVGHCPGREDASSKRDGIIVVVGQDQGDCWFPACVPGP